MFFFTQRWTYLLRVLLFGGSLAAITFILMGQEVTVMTVDASETDTTKVYLPIVFNPPDPCYYVETDDAVVVEIESAMAVDDWILENSFSGFAGSGYYTWRGPQYLGTPGVAILSYPISLTKQGTYRLDIHNWHPTFPSDMNDVWVRLDEGNWIKGFSNKINQWTWDFNFDQGTLGPAYFHGVTPGLHVLQLSARSYGFSMDRFALSTNGSGQSTSLPESPCVVP